MTQHRTVLMSMLPITLAVFVGFLIIGMQLPVLPLHLNQTLGMGTLVVGVVIGAQFAAALLSRAWAGNFADMRGLWCWRWAKAWSSPAPWAGAWGG
nr:hypothetical protein [Pseudomonas sp. FH1]